MDISFVFAGGSLLLLLLVLVIVRLNRRATQQRATETFLDDLGPAPRGTVTSSADMVVSELPSEAPRAPAPSAFALARIDPVTALVGSLLEGQGAFSQEELRRLELYRPEKVIAAAEAAEPALGSKGKEAKRARLFKIRQHADALLHEGNPKTLETEAASEVPELEAPELPEPLAAPPDPPPAPEASPALQPSPSPEAVSAVATSAFAAVATPAAAAPAADPASLAAPAADVDPDADTLSGLPPAPSGESMDDQWDLWESELGEPVEEEYENFAAFETVDELGAEDEIETVDELQAAVGAADSPADSAEQCEPLSAFEVHISSAEDVLSLSPQERRDALCFLSLEELGRAYGKSADPELKYAVVDLLESADCAESLVLLDEILEGSDPEMQLYALDAAERLLERV